MIIRPVESNSVLMVGTGCIDALWASLKDHSFTRGSLLSPATETVTLSKLGWAVSVDLNVLKKNT